MTTPMKSWQFSAWHSWHVMIVTRDLWRGSSDLRRDQCNGPRRPLTIPCHCLMGPATNFHQTCNTALYCICTAPPSSQFPLIIIMSRLTLPVAGSSCSLECSTWISLTPASREQNWNDYIKTSTFPINQPTAAHCSLTCISWIFSSSSGEMPSWFWLLITVSRSLLLINAKYFLD